MKVATKHDIETIINHIKHFENDAREQHDRELLEELKDLKQKIKELKEKHNE